jgi:hypothetical protein
MKTIKTANGSIIRVKDETARAMVRGEGRYKKGDYYFIGKEEWKKEVRGPVKKVEPVKKTDAAIVHDAVEEHLAEYDAANDGTTCSVLEEMGVEVPDAKI